MHSDGKTIQERWHLTLLVMATYAVISTARLANGPSKTVPNSYQHFTNRSSTLPVQIKKDVEHVAFSATHRRVRRQLDHQIPFVQSSGLIDSPESRTIAAGVCKAQCLKECADNLQQKSLTDST
ncbi:hypothetical protein FBUS_01509 [Fasciolopsis buskii]|uniref:Uncharacterized protein n=1 Tax=Fasciolopsis buskii TaxID=27845 RepID=A0A8E0RXC7_9TREM|nr:hypothetical protein FBUS_01509 [Fasciolopsis buski]